jgi:glycosyltransferase involved in cell wall biosynthesis
LLVVDDGSTDNTAGIAEEMGWDVYRLPRHLGKSAAIRGGVRNMGAVSRQAFTDADGQYKIEDVLDLYLLTDHADVAVARRAAHSSDNLWRSFCHSGYSHLSQLILPTGVSDPQAGAMAFKGPAIDLWKEVTTDRYMGPSEVLFKAKRLGLRVLEKTVDINTADNSHVKPGDAFKMLADLISFRFSV